MLNWNALTQKYEEEFDCEPILLTSEEYVCQLLIGSSEWFKTSEANRIVLVDNAIKWTLVYIEEDGKWVKLQKGSEIIKVFAQNFTDQYSFDFAV